jgi:hypothetical protein
MIRPATYIVAAVVTQVVGCASIVNGSNQSVSVETRSDAGPISGANCRLSNNKGTWFVTSPGSTTVQRSYEDLAVRCDKEGSEPGLASVKSSTKAMAFGNIIFGGIIGAGVDMSTGAAYDYPSLISVIMGRSTAIAAPTQTAAPAAGAPPAAAVSGPAK